jgi:transposase
MHVEVVPNRKAKPTILLRESYREGSKVKKRTICNITNWEPQKIETMRRLLKGQKLVAVDDMFETVSSAKHGHVKAVMLATKRLGFDKLIDSRPSRERDLVVAMVTARILNPASKLATQRSWKDTTLPQMLGVDGVDENDLYSAMDWLVVRQPKIEKRLAKRHLAEGGQVLYDLSSSYFEGSCCPLAKLGYSRDGVKGKLQVNYGLLTDARGCPVAVSVFDGNISDPKTLLPALDKVRGDFGIKQLVLVGDRGMISQKQIDELKKTDGVAWISALKTGAIRTLVDDGKLQLGLFDERNLFECTHPDFAGERLVACRNPELAKLRAHTRQSLLEATTKLLEKVRAIVDNGRLKGADAIGVRVGKAVNKHKVAKHFMLDICENSFDFCINAQKVAEEAALDGIYVVRTSVPKSLLSDDDTVRSYKKLAAVERAFRTLKSVDLQVRPIHHHDENRVRAHIFLCMLAYYVEWHMREALRPLIFADENLDAKLTRDPVAAASRSSGAHKKITTKTTADGLEVHSFRTLIDHLAAIVRNMCKRQDTEHGATEIIIETTPDRIQQKAFDLLKQITL